MRLPPNCTPPNSLGLILLGLLVSACGDDREPMSGDGTATGVSGDEGDTGEVGDDGEDDGIERYDVPPGGDDGADDGGSEMGCSKVDFLFVVDNSSSMADKQANLAASFPGFIDAIQAQVEGQDYHIMVVDSDENPTWFCEPSVSNGDPACFGACHPSCSPQNFACGGYTCGATNTLDAEDTRLGCGVVRPLGGEASNVDCGVPEGKRYVTASQPDLDGTFGCMAKVGVSGHWFERPASATLAALDPDNLEGGCNDGFLRDDAILVLVWITDDFDRQAELDDAMPGINGTPQDWYEAVIDAKSGDPSAVVMLGVLATPTPPPGPSCRHGGDDAALKFIEFVDLFGDQGRVVDACEQDYSPFFSEAVGLIDTTCDGFVPPG